MSQEPRAPGLMKCCSKAKLDLDTFTSQRSGALLYDRTKNGANVLPHASRATSPVICPIRRRLKTRTAGECHCVWQRTHNEMQCTCISIGDISSSAVTACFWAALPPARSYGLPAVSPFRISFLVSPPVMRKYQVALCSDLAGMNIQTLSYKNVQEERSRYWLGGEIAVSSMDAHRGKSRPQEESSCPKLAAGVKPLFQEAACLYDGYLFRATGRMFPCTLSTRLVHAATIWTTLLSSSIVQQSWKG